ncbi:MAG: hypothetical protein HOO67_06480 [Candidatus Peribacteraceae bacterium]|nr:hypothetical protein [Candidatus Peribacteraceae bacterium]
MHILCVNCGSGFEFSDLDAAFYTKIAPIIGNRPVAVPPPTRCPDCRSQRRLAYRNEQQLYYRTCDRTGRTIISMFDPDAPFVIYDPAAWWKDDWDPMSYGRQWTGGGFFEQFQELLRVVPQPSVINNNAENADFCNFADGSKDSYLSTSTHNVERTYYSWIIVNTRSVSDVLWCIDCELLYECIDCRNCYDLRYSQNCESCTSGSFLINCQGVKNSLFCCNLRNAEYHLFNKPVSKEEYETSRRALDGSASRYAIALERFAELKRTFPIRRASNIRSSENAQGDNIVQCQNIRSCFDIQECRDCAYLQDCLHGTDCQDCSFFDGAELCLESSSLIGNRCLFTLYCRDSSALLYCVNCHGCTDCFGCVALRNKKHCVFNRQYTKEQYTELTGRIITQMQANGEWGEFFPIAHSPFPYNDTIAHLYYPLTAEKARTKGYPWKMHSDDGAKAEGTVAADSLPDRIADVPDDVVQRAVRCPITGKPFRLIKQELELYRQMQIPLPRLHPVERTRMRIAQRNPRKLWMRTCANCKKEIQTTYAPERPEVVYCEECYLKEVY